MNDKKILITCLILLSVVYSKESKKFAHKDKYNNLTAYYIIDQDKNIIRLEKYDKDNSLVHTYKIKSIQLGYDLSTDLGDVDYHDE